MPELSTIFTGISRKMFDGPCHVFSIIYTNRYSLLPHDTIEIILCQVKEYPEKCMLLVNYGSCSPTALVIGHQEVESQL